MGQFLTPNPVAEFMASLFEIRRSEVHLLDAGAGAGALSAALVGRLCREPQKPKRIQRCSFHADATVETVHPAIPGQRAIGTDAERRA